MQRDKAIYLLENTKFDPNSQQDFLNRLNVLAKYDENIIPEFDHDVCWASDFDKTITLMSREEVIYMALCGWYYDDDNESWAHR